MVELLEFYFQCSGPLLVHCSAGRNRSAAVLAGLMVLLKKLTWPEAVPGLCFNIVCFVAVLSFIISKLCLRLFFLHFFCSDLRLTPSKTKEIQTFLKMMKSTFKTSQAWGKCWTKTAGGGKLPLGLAVYNNIWLWVKKKTPRDHRFWPIFRFTIRFLGYPFFDPQPYNVSN